MDVFTSVAANYIPKARVLADSLKRHQPDARFHLLVVDGLPESFRLENEPFDALIPLEQLPIPDLKPWLFGHSLVEACTAVKPFALDWLLAQGAERVCYFDPDIALFAPLKPIETAFRQYSILLTPHICKPEASLEAIKDNELNSLRHGLYNFGFVGVKNDKTGLAYAEWWRTRVYHWCHDDIPSGVFTDQKWNDLVPLFFDSVGILKHPGLNVATWNYAQRKLRGTIERGVTVDGEPLIFHHFTGYDSGAHHVMRDKYGRGMPAAMHLSRWYEDACQRFEQKELARIPWAYGHYDNGEKIAPAHRRLWRERQDLREAFEDPFSAQPQGKYSASYYHWLKREGLFDAPDAAARAPKSFRLFLQETQGALLYYIRRTHRLPRWTKRLAAGLVSVCFGAALLPFRKKEA